MKTTIPEKYLAAGAIVGAAIFVYLQQFIFPHLPVIPSGDQTVYLLDGQRMLHGQVLYRDFFQFLFPGTEFFFYSIFKIFGVHAWISGAVLVFIGASFVAVSVAISRQLFTGSSILLPGMLFLAIPFRNGPMEVGSHHWLSALAVMAAVAVLMDQRSPRRLLLGGALCGLAAWFNQTRGPAGLVGIALFLLWEWHEAREPWPALRTRLVRLGGGFLATLAALTSYFIARAGLREFFYSTFVFLFKYAPAYPSNRWNQYGADMPFHYNWMRVGGWLATELLVPYSYVLFFWYARRARKQRPDEPWDRLMLLAIVGLCLFLSVVPSAMNYRLCTISLPAYILVAWVARPRGNIKRIALPLLWIGILALMVAETHEIQKSWHATLDLPMGRVACFSRPDVEEFRWFLCHQKPTDTLVAPPELVYPLGLANPTPIDFLSRSDFTRPDQVQSIIEGMETKRTRWLDWAPYRGTPFGPDDHLLPLIEYLRVRYHVAAVFENGRQTILERNEP